ncbi:E3 ubiquitin-protein ligase SPL2 [Dichanthelium oligosanthes]|uniref:RING-type E3 ubiquitin transferase n=1 Tax=Dichanthelium oligosanthes TaxID=888268 RepID=A0A1E5UU38_9POAL|nr:E3 ubiquitin-protein ligase SPL2 [Dichanthelium oligosanthes]
MSARDRETAEALVRLAASLDGAVLGLGTAAVAVASWVKYLAVSGQLRLVASAATASIADLRSLLSGDGGESRIAAVRGYVRPKPGGTILNSELSGEYGVVTKHTQMCLFTEWRGIFGWTFDLHALLFRSWKEQIVTSFRSVPFVLASSEIGNPTGMVHINVENADEPLPLTTVFHKLIPIETTPYTLFQTIIGNGYPIALLDEEKILPIGKELTAIGLCRAKDEGSVEISSCPELPFFLSELTKDEMQAQLASRARILFWSSIVLGTMSGCLVGHAIYRYLS